MSEITLWPWEPHSLTTQLYPGCNLSPSEKAPRTEIVINFSLTHLPRCRPPLPPPSFLSAGHFIYLEATPVGLKGDKAHIRSSVWRESSAICKLSFWYYISHKASGTIRLLIKVSHAQDCVWTQIRFKSHNHHRNWWSKLTKTRLRELQGSCAADRETMLRIFGSFFDGLWIHQRWRWVTEVAVNPWSQIILASPSGPSPALPDLKSPRLLGTQPSSLCIHAWLWGIKISAAASRHRNSAVIYSALVLPSARSQSLFTSSSMTQGHVAGVFSFFGCLIASADAGFCRSLTSHSKCRNVSVPLWTPVEAFNAIDKHVSKFLCKCFTLEAGKGSKNRWFT